MLKSTKYTYKYVQAGGGSKLDQYVYEVLSFIDKSDSIYFSKDVNGIYVHVDNVINVYSRLPYSVFFPNSDYERNTVEFHKLNKEYLNYNTASKFNIDDMTFNNNPLNNMHKNIIFYIIITAYVYKNSNIRNIFSEKIGGMYEHIKGKVILLDIN